MEQYGRLNLPIIMARRWPCPGEQRAEVLRLTREGLPADGSTPPDDTHAPRCSPTCSPMLNYTGADGLPGFLFDVIDRRHDGGRDVTAVM
jgi:hypothetical protein